MDHFGSSHFCSSLRCSRVEAGCGVLFLSISGRRRTMPRRGWLPAPDGWVQIIRGPRPPSAKWPVATATRQSSNTVKKQGDVGGAQRPQARGRWRQPPARVSPRVLAKPRRKRVAQLEGALKASDATGPEVTMIQESLKSAKRAAQVPPSHRTGLSVRAVHCTGAETVGRTRRGANSVGQAAGGWSAASPQPPKVSQSAATSSTATRLGSPGCESPTNGERSAIRAGRIGGADPCGEDRYVTTSRTSGNRPREEHSCNADFDSRRALSMDGRPTGGFTECFCRRRRRSDLRIDFKDGEGGRIVDPVDTSVEHVRRRVCVAGSAWRGAVCPVVSPLSVPLCLKRLVSSRAFVVRSSRYGLRGCRVGEASNPGPRVRRRRRVLSNVSRSDSNFYTLLDGMEEDLSVGVTVPVSSEAILEVQQGGIMRDSPEHELVQIHPIQRDSVQFSGATPVAVPRSVRDSESDTGQCSRHRPEDT